VQREEELGRAAEQLREDRDEAVRRAYEDGMTMRDIASVLAITHQRVSQIIRS
jgi:DNA-directed RNA polymerase specialized sigma subunit